MTSSIAFYFKIKFIYFSKLFLQVFIKLLFLFLNKIIDCVENAINLLVFIDHVRFILQIFS